MTVSQLTRMVKRALEQNVPTTVHVAGELSNFKRPSSGHLYFVIKDEHCELSCVMWKAAAAKLKFSPADGLEIVATGNVDVFERSGRYQLYVRRIEPRGVGVLELAFRQMREKLEREGLFRTEHKKKLPRFPQRIAIVTSPTGAAVRDIRQTIARRWPAVELLLLPVTVQGPTAPGEVAAAVRTLNDQRNALGGIDCMIVGRGGGSLEDLWAFNEEIIARAIFESDIPVISAVGHEVDVTISDMVADVRAATPTAAAELAVPSKEDVLEQLHNLERHIARVVAHRVALAAAEFNNLAARPCFRDPMTLVLQREQAVDETSSRLRREVNERAHRIARKLARIELAVQGIRPDLFTAKMGRAIDAAEAKLRWAGSRNVISAERRLAASRVNLAWKNQVHRIERSRDRVDAFLARLDATSYQATLARGFSITRTKKGRQVVRSSDQIADGHVIVSETASGSFESRIINLAQKELFD